MVSSQLNQRIKIALDTLDALYFFVQSIPGNTERLHWIRENFEKAPRRARSVLYEELRSEIKWVRRESGAIASDRDFVRFYSEGSEGAAKGRIFIPKWEIDRRWFSTFARVIGRWPYVKPHAMVVYDPKDGEVRNQIFELEGALFRDAEVLVEQARNFHKGIADFRERARADQLLLHTYLRTAATVVFHYLEAYLNGLAFDCLLRHHDELSQADHDLLAEWNSKSARRAFVSADTKIFQYPVISGKGMGIKVDLSACKAAHFLASDAKELRDALNSSVSPFGPRGSNLEENYPHHDH